MSTITAAKKSTTATEPREALKRAISRRAECEAALKESRAAFDRATAAHAEAEAELRQFEDLDERLAKQKADTFKRGKPGPADTMVSEKQQRDQLKWQASEIKGALVVLEAEHVQAEKAVAAATDAASTAAWKLLATEAVERLTVELVAAKKLAWRLESVALALDQVSGLETRGEVRLALGPLMARLSEAAYLKPDPVVVGSERDPLRVAGQRWRELRSRLLKDADAEISWN